MITSLATKTRYNVSVYNFLLSGVLLIRGLREYEFLLQRGLEVGGLFPRHLSLAWHVLQKADSVDVVVNATQHVFYALLAAKLLELVHECVHIEGTCKEELTE